MAANYDLGTARGRIDIDTAGAQRNLAAVARGQDNLKRSGTNAQTAARTTGLAMAGIGAAAVAGFGLAVKTAANFEKGLSGVAAVSGATGAEMDRIRDKALKLGADTSFSATEATSAMEELVKAGLSVDDVLNGAADATVALAAAGEVALPEAATIAANAMNQFNLSADDMVKVSDLIAGAANASAIDVSDFGLAMQQAGATANLVGLSFDDMAVAIAAMGNAGIKGSDAGTSLKTFLANLQPTTEKQIKLFKELGLVTEDGANKFFDQEGKIRSMTEIAGVLNGALAGMTEQQKALALETLFGSDAIRAAAIISNEGAVGINNLAESMGKVSAQDVAAKRLDNFEGSVEQLKGSLETLVIQVGTPFLGFLRQVVDGITKGVNAFTSLPEPVRTLISVLTLAAGALVGVGGALILAFSYFSKLKAVLTALKIGALLTNPVFLAIAVIAALALGLYLLYQRSQTVRDIVDAVGRTLKSVAERVVEFWRWIDRTVKTLGGWEKVLKTAGIALAAVLLPIPALIAGIILLWQKSELFRNIITSIGRALVAAAKFFKDFGLQVAETSQEVFDWLNKNVFPTFFALGELVQSVVDRVIRWINFMMPVFRAQFGAILVIVKTAFNGVKTTIQTALIATQGVITFILGAIRILWDNFGKHIITAITIVWNWIKLIIETTLGIIRGIIQIVTGLISGDWSKVWEGIQTLIDTVWNAIKGIIQTALDIIKLAIGVALSAINAAWDIAWLAMKTVIETVWRIIQTIVKNAIDSVKRIITEGIEIVVRFFREMPGKIVQALGDLTTKLVDAGTDLLFGFVTGYTGIWLDIISFFVGLPGEILGWLGDLGGILYDAGVQILEGLLNGMKSVVGKVTGFLGELGDKIIPGSKGPEEKDKKILVPAGQWIIEGLVDGIASAVPMLKSALGDVTTGIQASMSPSLTPLLLAGSSGGGGDHVELNFNFGNLTSTDVANDVKQTLSSAEMLSKITLAVRAGKR